MLKKKTFLAILSAILLTGCGESKLEPYEQESTHTQAEINENEYMAATTLWLGEETIPCFVLSKNYQNDGECASGSQSGITTEVSVYSTAEISAEELIETTSEEECSRIVQIDGYSDVAFYDATNEDGCYLRQMSYSIVKNDISYPCMTIIKEEPAETSVTQTVVYVDNTKTDSDSERILTEVLRVYGIELE